MKRPAALRPFVCRGFVVHHDRCGLKVGTDTIFFAAHVAQSHWVSSRPPRTALDVGPGTGLLSLILAHRLPSLEVVHGVEIDADAYEHTKLNYELSPWRDKLRAFHASFQDFVNKKASPLETPKLSDDTTASTSINAAHRLGLPSYDLIICNPPYHPRPPRYPHTEPTSRAHARFSDYLSPTDLLSGVNRCLHQDGGQFWLFYPHILADRITREAAQHDLSLRHRCDICFRRGKHWQRSILMFERSTQKKDRERADDRVERVEATLREEDSSFTDEFVEATKDIYLETLRSDRNRHDNVPPPPDVE